MNKTITDTRALLRLFEQSDYGELYVREGDYQLFLARTAGRTNPLRRGASVTPVPLAAPEAKPSAAIMVTAPHIASLISALPVGSAVAAGDIVARIALLDEEIDIAAEQAGMVDAILAQPGALVEYATPILSLVAAA